MAPACVPSVTPAPSGRADIQEQVTRGLGGGDWWPPRASCQGGLTGPGLGASCPPAPLWMGFHTGAGPPGVGGGGLVAPSRFLPGGPGLGRACFRCPLCCVRPVQTDVGATLRQG